MLKPEDGYWGRPYLKAPKEYIHAVTLTPWPIKDRKYDFFIDLQAWEYLGDKQKDAFIEVMCISRMAILNFPYMWNYPTDDPNYAEHLYDR